MRQLSLCCPCGSEAIRARGLCARCYRSRRLSRKRFDGKRDSTIVRDGRRCVICRSERVIVHHRSEAELVTLCVYCHPRVHRTLRPRYGEFDEFTRKLWREQHPDVAEQLELSFSAKSTVTPIEQSSLFAA